MNMSDSEPALKKIRTREGTVASDLAFEPSRAFAEIVTLFRQFDANKRPQPCAPHSKRFSGKPESCQA